MKSSGMARKIFATVSDQLAERLEKRAEEEGRSLSNLIGYLLERGMENWQPEKKQNPQTNQPEG